MENVHGLLRFTSLTGPWSFSRQRNSCVGLQKWPLVIYQKHFIDLFLVISINVRRFRVRVHLLNGASNWWLKINTASNSWKETLFFVVIIYWNPMFPMNSNLFRAAGHIFQVFLCLSQRSNVWRESHPLSLTLIIYGRAAIHSHLSSGCTTTVVMTTKRLISGGQGESAYTEACDKEVHARVCLLVHACAFHQSLMGCHIPFPCLSFLLLNISFPLIIFTIVHFLFSPLLLNLLFYSASCIPSLFV